jgi:hypothetical protein
LLEPTRVFSLSNEAGSLGLSCGQSGVALAGVPLLFRSKGGFQPRSEEQIRKLISDAYRIEADGARLTAGLSAVARALNADDIAHAMTAAVLLKLPELDWDGAVRIAQAENALANTVKTSRVTGMEDGRPEPATHRLLKWAIKRR